MSVVRCTWLCSDWMSESLEEIKSIFMLCNGSLRSKRLKCKMIFGATSEFKQRREEFIPPKPDFITTKIAFGSIWVIKEILSPSLVRGEYGPPTPSITAKHLPCSHALS